MKSKKKYIVIILIIVIVLLLVSRRGHKDTASQGLHAQNNVMILNSNDYGVVSLGKVENIVSVTGDLKPILQTEIGAEVVAVVKRVVVNEGQYVTKNQVLAYLDDREKRQNLDEKMADLAKSKVTLELAKVKLDKEKYLLEQGFISKYAYSEDETNYKSCLEDVNDKQALANNAGKQLSDTVIRAPFAGYIAKKNVENGQLVNGSTALFTLANLDKMQIIASVPNDQISQFKIGQRVRFKVPASDTLYQGAIMRINPVADTNTRTYNVYVSFDNTHYKLNSGQFAQGYVVVSSMDKVNCIANSAIKHFFNKNYVLVINNKKVVEKRWVKVLIVNMVDNIAGVSGLNLIEKVINGNVISIKEGDKIKIMGS